MAMLPFQIEFSDEMVADLHRRIDTMRWPLIEFETGWSAGTNDEVLRELVQYWRFEFDWFEVQKSLNRYEHLRGLIGIENLHCVLLSGTGEARIPLLLLHGWPGSFIELLPAAELLAAGVDGRQGFDVVVPSLPGFGFSDSPRQTGMHPGRIAGLMHQLMTDLGYERYGIQGGDWGAIIGSRLAIQQEESVMGLHLNFPAGIVALPEDDIAPKEELEWRIQMTEWREREGAYGHIQGTKPQTLAYGLMDSPVGLLAWILEKFWAWSEHDGVLWETLDRDSVLANVTLYWLTGTALSSMRTYYESRRESPQFRSESAPSVPMGFASYPGEPWGIPRTVMERSFQLVRWNELRQGGHFAAMEQPQLFAADVTEFFRSLNGS